MVRSGAEQWLVARVIERAVVGLRRLRGGGRPLSEGVLYRDYSCDPGLCREAGCEVLDCLAGWFYDGRFQEMCERAGFEAGPMVGRLVSEGVLPAWDEGLERRVWLQRLRASRGVSGSPRCCGEPMHVREYVCGRVAGTRHQLRVRWRCGHCGRVEEQRKGGRDGSEGKAGAAAEAGIDVRVRVSGG